MKTFTNYSRTLALLGAVSATLAPALAHADRMSEIKTQLREFELNSVKAMSRIPVKRDARTGVATSSITQFSEADIASGEFVAQKDSVRKNICTDEGGARICLGDVIPGRAAFEEGDLAESLVDNRGKMLRTLEAIENKKLMSAALKETPWSDHYWPIYQGILGARYADDQSPRSKNWNSNKKYYIAANNDFASIYQTQNASSIDNLSPSEKYDLLVGDTEGTLTNQMWAEGNGFYEESGKVETWMGICHGWAPASYMLGRPKHTVDMMAADGKTKITFYPSDIKALGSLLWANAKTTSRFMGGRCNDKKPKTDSAGRVYSQDCFDTNPGSWHLAVVNQIGVSHRSMVIDATYDYEVWNQPVYAYEYTYFNPQTQDNADTLEAATVSMNEFSADKFKRYRSKKAVSVVGIAMDITYILETQPSHAKTDSPRDDNPKTVRYMYDLELDANGKIIGGEWYQNTHPDFVWTPSPTTKARSVGDRYATGNWNGKGSMPASWQRAAASASETSTPLGKIVDLLTVLGRL